MKTSDGGDDSDDGDDDDDDDDDDGEVHDDDDNDGDDDDDDDHDHDHDHDHGHGHGHGHDVDNDHDGDGDGDHHDGDGDGDVAEVDVQDEEEDDDVEEENRSQDREAHSVEACAVEMHMGISQGQNGHFTSLHKSHFVWKFTEKCRTPILGTAFCASLRSRMHMDISQEPFCMDIKRKNAGPPSQARHFVRACAVETCMDKSQSHFVWKFTEKTAGHRGDHLDRKPGLNCYPENP